jgi:ferredoxin
MLEGVIRQAYEAPLWREEALRCVECGACNTVCPTCHCFLLLDQLHSGELDRFRLWDSCLLKDFAQVAGGANPRPQLWMRLREPLREEVRLLPAAGGTLRPAPMRALHSGLSGQDRHPGGLERNVEYVQKR